MFIYSLHKMLMNWLKLKSQPAYNTAAQFLRLHSFFKVKKFWRAIPYIVRVKRGRQKCKMGAGSKPEMGISQLVYNMSVQFQRLYPCFHGPEIQEYFVLYIVWCKWYEFKMATKTENTYVCEPPSWISDFRLHYTI